jgi:hypothetical protein
MLSSLRGRSPRAKTLGVLLGAALVTTFAAPAHADPALQLTATASAGVVTLPIGDGFNDSEAVTVTAPQDLSADVTLNAPDGTATTIASGQKLLAATPTTITVPTDGLGPGAYTVHIAGTDVAATGSAAFRVGSGNATALTLSVPAAASSIYPHRTASVLVAIGAMDETGTALPLSGALVAKAGSTTRSTPITLAAGSAPFAYSVRGLPFGAATLTASATTPGGATATSPAVALHLKATAVTTVSLGRSITTVYPVKDGYRDSVRFTVTPHTQGVGSVPVTGKASITRKGRTAMTWKLHSGAQHLTWNGKAHGKLVAGIYSLTVTAKGPEGASKTARTTVVVSGKRAIRHTAEQTRTASSTLTQYRTFDEYSDGTCSKLSTTVACLGFDAYYDPTISLFVYGDVGVPHAVRVSTAIARPQVRVTVHATHTYGTAAWGYGIGGQSSAARLTAGSHTGKWLAYSGNPSSLLVSAALGQYSNLFIDKFTITHHYLTLK